MSFSRKKVTDIQVRLINVTVIFKFNVFQQKENSKYNFVLTLIYVVDIFVISLSRKRLQ